MKKTRIAVVLYIVLASLIPSGFVGASPLKSSSEMAVPVVRAQLQNLETGEKVTVPVTYKVQPAGKGRYVAIYDIASGPEMSVPFSYTYFGNSGYGQDKSNSVSAELWVYFWADEASTPETFQIDYYKARWHKLVADINWTSGQITAYCMNHLNCPQQTKTVACLSPGSWCYDYPSWRGATQNWDNLGANYAISTIWLKRGSSSWTYSLQVFVPNP